MHNGCYTHKPPVCATTVERVGCLHNGDQIPDFNTRLSNRFLRTNREQTSSMLPYSSKIDNSPLTFVDGCDWGCTLHWPIHRSYLSSRLITSRSSFPLRESLLLMWHYRVANNGWYLQHLICEQGQVVSLFYLGSSDAVTRLSTTLWVHWGK